MFRNSSYISKVASSEYAFAQLGFQNPLYQFHSNEVEEMDVGTNLPDPQDVTNGIGLLLSNKCPLIKLDVPWADLLLQWSRLFVSSSLEYSQGW